MTWFLMKQIQISSNWQVTNWCFNRPSSSVASGLTKNAFWEPQNAPAVAIDRNRLSLAGGLGSNEMFNVKFSSIQQKHDKTNGSGVQKQTYTNHVLGTRMVKLWMQLRSRTRLANSSTISQTECVRYWRSLYVPILSVSPQKGIHHQIGMPSPQSLELRNQTHKGTHQERNDVPYLKPQVWTKRNPYSNPLHDPNPRHPHCRKGFPHPATQTQVHLRMCNAQWPKPERTKTWMNNLNETLVAA